MYVLKTGESLSAWWSGLWTNSKIW